MKKLYMQTYTLTEYDKHKVIYKESYANEINHAVYIVIHR
jgi:hypothetical protein